MNIINYFYEVSNVLVSSFENEYVSIFNKAVGYCDFFLLSDIVVLILHYFYPGIKYSECVRLSTCRAGHRCPLGPTHKNLNWKIVTSQTHVVQSHSREIHARIVQERNRKLRTKHYSLQIHLSKI